MSQSLSRRRRLIAGVAVGALVLMVGVFGASAANKPITGWFVDEQAPASLGWSNGAGEPSIGVNWHTGAVLYQAGGGTYRINLDTDTWTDVSSPYTGFNIDPILATDNRTGLTLAGGDDGSCSILAATTDDGAAWTPSLPCTFTPDHPTVGIGPQVGSSQQQPASIAYFCQQYPVADECTASTTDGLAWLPGTPVTGGCTGPSGHVKVSADGTAYLPMKLCIIPGQNGIETTEIGGAVSTNDGLTWSSYFIPNAPWALHGFDPSVATSTDNNTVYEAWSGTNNFHPLVSLSHDHGATWTKPVDAAAGSPYPIAATTFHAMVAGDHGRIAVAYLGSDTPGTATVTPFDSGYTGTWYLYLSVSLNGGKTWTTVRAQDGPVQRGPICDNGTSCVSGRNLLDFMDATLDARGAVLIGYADGCKTGCNSSSVFGQSTDAWASVAREVHGPSMFAAVGNRG